MAKLRAIINLTRRLCKFSVAAKEIPDANTLAKRKMVIPPRTQSGILVMTPEILEKTPMKINQKPQANPARRLRYGSGNERDSEHG